MSDEDDVIAAIATAEFTGNFREFVDLAKGLVERFYSATSRDGDPPPAILFHRADSLHIVHPPLEYFSGARAKEALVHDVVVPLIEVGRCTKVAIFSAVFLVNSESPSGRRVFRLQQEGKPIPDFATFPPQDRVEQAMLSCTDPEINESWLATIRRRKYGHPLLQDWRDPGREAGSPMQGLFVDPIQEALR